MNKSDKRFTTGKVGFEIESLGPIRDSMIKFKPFLLFSGERNTGKSYTAMAVYYLFAMLNNRKTMTELTSKLFDIKKIDNDLKSKRMIDVEFPENLTDELEKLYNSNINRFMAYMLGYDSFSCGVKLKLKIPLSSGATIRIIQPEGLEWDIARLDARVRELNVSEKGMPMKSFERAYDQSVKETRDLREALTEHEE